MHTIANEQLINQLNWRYAVQQFDPHHKISPADWATLEEALILSPSSFGLQPWKFIVVTEPAIRARLVPVSYGQSKVAEASHLVVFAIKKNLGEKDVINYIDRIAEVRGAPREALKEFEGMLLGFVKGQQPAELKNWAARQAYIALGNFLTSAAVLGIDAAPMEGFDRGSFAIPGAWQTCYAPGMSISRILLWRIFFALGLATLAAPPLASAQSRTNQIRIGVYDSRAIAVAYASSKEFQIIMKPLQADFFKAKYANNEKLMKELKEHMEDVQFRLNQEAYSTGSVAAIMATIKHALPSVAKEAGVDMIISKWEVNFQGPNIQTEDVTDKLVALFHTSDQGWKQAKDIQQKPPLPIENITIHSN
jgi:nitroreductase